MNIEEALKQGIRGLKRIGKFRYSDTDEPHNLDCSLAGRVAFVFGVGMTKAIEMCRWAGEDPHFSETAERRSNTN